MYGHSYLPHQARRQGRPAQGLNVRINVTLTPALRDWLKAQDDDVSALIRQLLHAEQVRRDGLVDGRQGP